MALKVAGRGNIPPFIVMDVLREANAKAAAGDEVLHLEVGQPGTAAPEAVRLAAARALEADRIGYTDALGLPDLRRGIAGHYRARMGLEVDPARVVVTTGSSGAFLLSFLAAFDPGDVVAMAAPGYPAYRNILTALGIEPLLLETGPEERFQPTPDLLAGDRQDRRADRRLALQPDRDHAHRHGHEGAGGLLCRSGHSPGVRRNLPRHHLRPGGGLGPRLRRSGRGDQFLFEVLLHDRLAPRLDGAARGSSAPGGVPGAELLYLAADPVTGRRPGRLRLL